MATVLITGGNRGIGAALANHYRERGDTVLITQRAASAVPGVFRADVTDLASLQSVAKALAGRPIDVLICNAGMNDGHGGRDAASNTPDMWAKLLATNVTGVFFTAQTFAPNVIAARGKIAILSSRMGSSAAAKGSSYAYRASKAAASNIAANLAAEMQPEGVPVVSFHPGWVRTDMGGPGADIDAATSAAGLTAQIDALTLATSGSFLNYDGTAIAH